jgi:hypothetical protein
MDSLEEECSGGFNPAVPQHLSLIQSDSTMNFL